MKQTVNKVNVDFVEFLKGSKIDVAFRVFLLAEALASKGFISEEINRIYLENEIEYYEAYQRGLKFNQTVLKYPFMQMQTLRRVAGILYFELERSDLKHTLALTKKASKMLWHFLKNKQIFTLTEYINYQKNDSIFSNESLLYDIAIAKFICEHTVEFEFDGLEVMLDLIIEKKFESLDELYDFHVNLYNSCNGNVVEKKTNQTIYTLLSQIKNNHANQFIREFQKNMNDYEAYVKFINNPKSLFKKQIDFEREEEMEEYLNNLISRSKSGNVREVKKKQIINASKVQFFFHSLLLSVDGLSFDFGVRLVELMKTNSLSKEKLEVLLSNTLEVTKELNLSDREQQIFLVMSLYIQFLVEDYLKLYEIVTNGSYEKNVAKVEVLTKELFTANKKVEQANSEIKYKEKQYLARINELENQVKSLQSQVETNTEHKTIEELAKEVIGLRQYLYTTIDEKEVIKVPLEEMKKFIAKKKILIMGGHKKWQQKVKESIPSIKNVYVDEINRDFKFISGHDYVFVNTSVLSHGFYMKLMKTFGDDKDKLRYLSGKVNIEKTIEEIYLAIK